MDHPVQIGSISHNTCFSKIQLSCRVEQAPQWPLCVTTNPALVAAASLLKLRKLYLRRSEGIVGINKDLRSSSNIQNMSELLLHPGTWSLPLRDFKYLLSWQFHIHRTFLGSFFYTSTCCTWTRCCTAPFCSSAFCPCRLLRGQRGSSWDMGDREDGKGKQGTTTRTCDNKKGNTEWPWWSEIMFCCLYS